MSRDVHVLLVEDNADEAYLIELALKQCIPNLKVAIVDSHQRLDDYLANLHQNVRVLPQLVLLDLYMPAQSDGLAMMATLKEHFTQLRLPPSPIVVFSHSNQLEDIQACYDLGANAYMLKAIGYPGMVEFFKTFCQYWLEVVTLPVRYY